MTKITIDYSSGNCRPVRTGVDKGSEHRIHRYYENYNEIFSDGFLGKPNDDDVDNWVDRMSRSTLYFYFVEPYLIEKVFPNTKWSGQQDLLDSTVSPRLTGGTYDQKLEKGNERGYTNGKTSPNFIGLLIFKILQEVEILRCEIFSQARENDDLKVG